MPKLVKSTVEIEERTEERYALVEEDALQAWPAAPTLVGRPFPRIEGAEKVGGGARYTSDVRLPGMLWTRTVRSPHPHARIARIDTRSAMAMPGVRAVLTHENAP